MEKSRLRKALDNLRVSISFFQATMRRPRILSGEFTDNTGVIVGIDPSYQRDRRETWAGTPNALNDDNPDRYFSYLVSLPESVPKEDKPKTHYVNIPLDREECSMSIPPDFRWDGFDKIKG